MLELREKEILSTLEKLKKHAFILIGGYAVNAYTQPRFSVDCDIVVLDKQYAEKVKKALEQQGYNEKTINPNIPYSGEFLCMEKKINNYTVPFDIMIGSVIDRETKLKFPAEWIFKNSKIKILTGKVSQINIQLRIASPETLIIMKLAASRKSDFRDIFMLLEKDINLDFVLTELKRFNLQNKLKQFKEYVISGNFKDSLHGVFGKIDEKLFDKIVKRIFLIETQL